MSHVCHMHVTCMFHMHHDDNVFLILVMMGFVGIRRALYKARLLANGERSRSKPVIRHISTYEDNDASPTQDDLVLASPALPGSEHTPQDNHLFVGGLIPMLRCACFCPPDITKFTTGSLKRSLCALMNGQEGGRVYLGVNKGVVKGTKISSKQVSVAFISTGFRPSPPLPLLSPPHTLPSPLPSPSPSFTLPSPLTLPFFHPPLSPHPPLLSPSPLPSPSPSFTLPSPLTLPFFHPPLSPHPPLPSPPHTA